MWKRPKLLLVAFVMLTGLWAGTTRIQASLATAPSGLNQLDKLFTVPATFSSGVKNSASIADVTNASSPNTQAMQVITGKKQVGGFWSNDANRLNLNEDATFKMWVYLGPTTSATKAGGGMAFVLQNDPNGTNAAAQNKSSSILGETLGTWGVDSDTKAKEPSQIAATAIQNSWALEFDTYANNSTSYSSASGDAFDSGIKKQHIASGYPGSASQYTSESVRSLDVTGLIWSTKYYFTQNHTNLTNVDLGDSKWHHLVMDWHADTKTMTYTYDDINADGSETGTGITQSEVIDTSQFNSDDGLVRWGFMGATGNASNSNMVVIESAPNLVDVKAAVKVTDTTKNKTVTAGSKVKAKHKLQYDYKLSYESGQLDWDNITAELDLPKNVTFDSAVVKYSDGTEQTITAPTAGATTASYTLDKTLSASQPTATIQLTGKADDVKVNGATTTTSATFKNKVFETTADAPDYTITVDQPIDLYLLKNSYTVTNGDDVKVQGLVVAEGSEQITNSSITIHPTLNGEKLDDFELKNGDDNESGYFQYIVKANQLKVGTNEVTFWASDMDDNESEVATAEIIVTSGELGFKTVSSSSTFKPITVNGTSQTTDREDDWEVVVSDNRGKGSSWQLQASVTDFESSNGKKLPGDVLFRQSGKTTTLNTQGTVIDSRTTTSDTDDYDVLGSWDGESGIFYQSNAGATPGTYSGQITWTLNNAPS